MIDYKKRIKKQYLCDVDNYTELAVMHCLENNINFGFKKKEKKQDYKQELFKEYQKKYAEVELINGFKLKDVPKIAYSGRRHQPFALEKFYWRHIIRQSFKEKLPDVKISYILNYDRTSMYHSDNVYHHLMKYDKQYKSWVLSLAKKYTPIQEFYETF